MGMKKRNKVNFTYLDVYLFARCLGNDKVPESGNNPLGMESYHFFKEKISLFIPFKCPIGVSGDSIITSTPQPKRNYSEDSHSPKVLSEDSLQSVLSIDYTTKSLQPMNPKQRIKCLKEAGVELVNDQSSADEVKCLMRLRQERQQVGCKCTGTSNCDPLKCVCSKEGIPCQSDGNRFPCKCGPKCANTSGKKVYSNLRIKYHYKHTFERITTEDGDISSSNHGDCELCRELTEERLQELFPVPAAANRKRTATNQGLHQGPKSVPPPDLTVAIKMSPSLPVETTVPITMPPSPPRDMTVSITSPPSPLRDMTVSIATPPSPLRDMTVSIATVPGIEEKNLLVLSVPSACSSHKPLSMAPPPSPKHKWALSTYPLVRLDRCHSTSPSPSRRFNDSQEQLVGPLDRSYDAPGAYWDSFLNRTDPPSPPPSPVRLVDYSADSLPDPPTPSPFPQYRFRRRTSFSRRACLESPMARAPRKKRSGRVVVPRRITVAPEEDEVAETVAEIALMQFRDIPAIGADSEGALV